MTIDLPEAPNKPVQAAAPEGKTAQPAPEAAQPAAEVASETTAPTQTADLPELDLIDQLWTAYRAQLDASLAQQSAAIAAENAKIAYEAATEKTEVRRSAVKEILDSFCQRLAEIRDPQSAAIVAAVQDAMQDEDDQPAHQDGLAMDYTEWCKIPTAEVVAAGVPGLGEKKAATLVDSFPTLGDLESARTEASKQHKHFCKMLGKGFGEKTADAIESIMSDLLMAPKHETKPTQATEAKPAATAEPEAEATTEPDVPDDKPADLVLDESESQDDSPAPGLFDGDDVYEDMDGDDSDDIYADVSGGDVEDEDADADDEHIAALDDDEDEPTWADEFFAQLVGDQKEAKTGWGESDKTHSEAWSKGNKAQESWPVSACPYDEDTQLENAIEWVRGWTSSSMMSMDL